MAKPIATYSFLPYLRIGLPNKIEQPDQDPSIKLRATFGLELTLESQAVSGAAGLHATTLRGSVSGAR